MQALLVLLLAGLVHARTPSLDRDWELYKSLYGKVYSADEELGRRVVWESNSQRVQRHNRDEKASFKMAVNQFADRMPMEMNSGRMHVHSEVPVLPVHKLVDLPASWDWRSAGVVGPVHDQGQTGDVLGFVASDAVESVYAIEEHKMVALSWAEFNDCCGQLAGQLPFTCIRDSMHGICSEEDYPSPQGACNPPACSVNVQVCSQGNVSAGNESALQLAVLNQPVLVLIDASHASFQMYQSGVYYEPSCSSVVVDHALLVVGYGTRGGEDYWICKNSWGTSWGQQGYVWLSRNRNNNCAVASYASLPVLCPSK